MERERISIRTKNKFSFMISIVICAVVVITAVTFAWLTYSDNAYKDHTVAEIMMEATITLDSSLSGPDVTVVANQPIIDNITVKKKTSSRNCYCRIMVLYRAKLAPEEQSLSQVETDWFNDINSQLTTLYNGSSTYAWSVKQSDGFFYLLHKTGLNIMYPVTTVDVFQVYEEIKFPYSSNIIYTPDYRPERTFTVRVVVQTIQSDFLVQDNGTAIPATNNLGIIRTLMDSVHGEYIADQIIP